MSLRPKLFAARALVHCYQLSLLDVELAFFVHYPFVVTVATQSIPFVLFFQGRFLERENIDHGTSMEEMIDAYNPATKTKVSTALLLLACPKISPKKS